jgi:alginate O-acetyltransferase complex protein AlgI
MVFSSGIFIFGFLPLFLGIYYLARGTARSWLMLLGSYAFYAWWKFEYLLLILGLSLIAYAAGSLAHYSEHAALRRWATRLGVTCVLLVLGYFKYAYFFAQTYSEVIVGLGGTSGSIAPILLPIGISFLAFQSISYILDVSRGDVPPARRLVDLLCFQALFPQLIAGPVLRYKDLAQQFEHRIHSVEVFASGVRRFIEGLSMKLIIADSVAPMADRLFALDQPSLLESWLATSAYAIQLLFDFAGYSAMAIGLGLMIGFRFVENFNAPYISRSITEFWRRWHISLSSWLRDYLYLPLGGNRSGRLKTYRNLLLTMVLGGLWHGAYWTFILWGCWHGAILAIERLLGSKSTDSVWPSSMAWPLTMLFVLIGWVMFRAESVTQAMNHYVGMLGLNGVALRGEIIVLNQPTEYLALLAGAMLALSAGAWQFKAREFARQPSLLLPLALFLFCSILLNARSNTPFLYFQF